MRRAGSDRHDVTWSGRPFLAVDPEAGRARDDFEALDLLRMQVRCRNKAALPEHVLDAEECSVRFLTGDEERHALARDRILDRLAGSCHVHFVPDRRDDCRAVRTHLKGNHGFEIVVSRKLGANRFDSRRVQCLAR